MSLQSQNRYKSVLGPPEKFVSVISISPKNKEDQEATQKCKKIECQKRQYIMSLYKDMV